MCRTENHHQNRGRNIVQPNGSTQKIQHRKHRQRHRHKEKRAVQKRNISPTCKVANPNDVVQKQKESSKAKPYTSEMERFPADQKRNGEQVSNAADLLDRFNPTCHRRSLFCLSDWGKDSIGNIDQHRQRKNHNPNP